MTLQEQLDAYRARFEAKAPREAREVMHRATDDLRSSGTLAGTVKVGDRTPDFTLPNAMGQLVSLRSLLGQGPLVLTFYRGKW